MAQFEHSRENEYSGCVVVIDDNAGLRQMLALALDTAGFDVVEAGTEIDLQRLLAQSRPDALLIDLQRSETEGIKVLSRMRARQSLRDVPILFLAGSDADGFRQLAMSKGADWFGLRPVGLIDLQRRVAQLIRRGRRAHQRTRQRVS
jgi:two-component system, OmpR family, phosphate regulon response regulator PhoB